MRAASRERSLMLTSVTQAETTKCPELLRESVLSFSAVIQIQIPTKEVERNSQSYILAML